MPPPRSGTWRGGRRARLLLAATACALAAAACALAACAPAGPERTELVVSAASDLRFAFVELGETFERETGVPVLFTFGSSGHLARQIERGAPVDVFAAADLAYVDELVDMGLILPDTRTLYARGFLVLWARRDASLRLGSLADVAQPRARIAIANPEHAPYGLAAREALRTAGLWETVQPSLVVGQDVNQTLQYAQTGNVDAAIVALSLALGPNAGDGRYTRIPEELHSPIDQALGVVAATRHEPEARAFARYVTGPTGRAILERHGFAVPKRPPESDALEAGEGAAAQDVREDGLP